MLEWVAVIAGVVVVPFGTWVVGRINKHEVQLAQMAHDLGSIKDGINNLADQHKELITYLIQDRHDHR